jgi:aquaporin Z
MTEQRRIALAEAIGTMILVVGGPGTAILATGGFLATSSVGELGVAIAFGLSLVCAAYAIGSISGCHINPAVTAGLWALGKTKSRDVPFYVGGQVVGGIVGAAIIYVIAHSHGGFSAKLNGFASNGYGAHSPGGFKLPAVILAEIVFTGLFVFVIASTSRKSMSPGFTGLTVGLMLTVIHLITIPVDNTSVNPARSLATAIFQHGWALGQVWVFVVFPVIGGVVGALAWKVLVPAADA